MLDALCEEEIVTKDTIPKISCKEMIDYIEKNINHLKFDVKRQVGRIPIQRGYKDKVSECNEGIAIVLDLPETVIEEMYNLIFFEIQRI